MVDDRTRWRGSRRRGSTRAGYIVAAAVDLVVLWIMNQLLGWGWPPFLTSSFQDLLPFIDVSLVASAVVNLSWAWRDPEWFHHLAQIGLNLIGLVVAVKTWQIFPFDFSGSGWETVTRMLIALAVGVIVVATVVEVVKLIIDGSGGSHPPGRRRDATGAGSASPA